MKLKNKTNCPFEADEIVTALTSFAWRDGVIHKGEQRRGGDPVVVQNWSIFTPGALLMHELPNMWGSMPAPPQHAPPVQVSASIPPHRQVEATVDVWFDGGFVPNSPGAKSGKPSGFGSAIRRGAIYDALDEHVRRHPEWFSWVRRQVMPADLERLERLEELDHA